MAYDDSDDEGFNKPVEEGKTYTVTIDDLGSKGDGIARVEGFVVFVPETDVGETVEVEINSVGRKFAFGEVVSRDVEEQDVVEEPDGQEAAEEDVGDTAVDEPAGPEEPAEPADEEDVGDTAVDEPVEPEEPAEPAAPAEEAPVAEPDEPDEEPDEDEPEEPEDDEGYEDGRYEKEQVDEPDF